MASDLIQGPLLRRCKKGKLLYLRQRFRHERLSEIEPLLAADNIFHSPADPLGSFERSLIMNYLQPISFVFVARCCLQMRNGRKRAKTESLPVASKKQRVKRISKNFARHGIS
jgi:hypothetical protein